MNNMNKTCLVVGALILSNLTIEPGNIEDEFSFELGFNTANAYDIEIITVYGDRYIRPNYYYALKNITYSDYGGDPSEGREIDEREEARIREGYCRLQPSGCDSNNSPSLLPDGCSTEFAGVNFFQSWDATFLSACNQHDTCYVSKNSTFSSCNTAMREDMLDICSARNAEAINSGGYFNTSECWDKSSEYYMGVTLFGSSYFEAGQRDRACTNWIDSTIGNHC
jgi:hypothetical protein